MPPFNIIHLFFPLIFFSFTTQTLWRFPPCNVFLSSLHPFFFSPLTAHCHYSIPQPPIPPPCNTHIRQQIVGMCWFPGKRAALSVPPLHYLLHPQLNTRMICNPSQAYLLCVSRTPSDAVGCRRATHYSGHNTLNDAGRFSRYTKFLWYSLFINDRCYSPETQIFSLRKISWNCKEIIFEESYLYRADIKLSIFLSSSVLFPAFVDLPIKNHASWVVCITDWV